MNDLSPIPGRRMSKRDPAAVRALPLELTPQRYTQSNHTDDLKQGRLPFRYAVELAKSQLTWALAFRLFDCRDSRWRFALGLLLALMHAGRCSVVFVKAMLEDVLYNWGRNEVLYAHVSLEK